MGIAMQDIFYKSMALLNNYTDEGVILPSSETIDLQAKAILFADMAQKELYKLNRTEKTFNFSQKSAINLLGNTRNFDQIDFVGTSQQYPEDGNGVVGAKAYYFESTGAGTAYIEEYDGANWNALYTINMPLGSEYVVYKGTITPSNVNFPIRLRFGGTTWYRHVNRCLYSTPYALSQIPSYRPYIPVTLPADFMDLNQLIVEYSDGDYAKNTDYKWEEPNHLYIDYYFDANYRMIYNAIPVTVTSMNDVLSCNDVIGQAIAYYVAAKLAPYLNQDLTNFYEQKYQELKQDAKSKRMSNWERVPSNIAIGGF